MTEIRELREEIARMVAEFARDSDLVVLRKADYEAADRILAIPRLQEALK